jgi:YNFM family putative membrane transporter
MVITFADARARHAGGTIARRIVHAQASPTSSQVHASQIERGTPAFRRTNLAMFAAGFATFALIYCVQPLLPALAGSFGVGAATSSLALSATTGVLAVALLAAGAVSEAWGRKPIMVASLLASSVLTMLSALVPGWHALIVLRAFEGLAFAGLPALAMAYLSEEIHARSIGFAMGLYIAGTAIGGMMGRLIAAAVADLAGWRVAVGTIGALGLVATLIVWRRLPPSAHFRAQPLAPRAIGASYAAHLREPALLALFVEGLLLMGSFVAIYNYVAFRLLAPPYRLSQTAVGLIFLVYLIGSGSSAWVGHLAGRIGRGIALGGSIALMLAGVAITLATPLAVIVLGISVLTFGFFGAHSVASSWVGLRASAARAQASALYLFFYYVGSSAAGWLGGIFWSRWGWPGVCAFVATMLVVALGLCASPSALGSRRPTEPPGDRMSR